MTTQMKTISDDNLDDILDCNPDENIGDGDDAK
jgi:hypothetical protein